MIKLTKKPRLGAWFFLIYLSLTLSAYAQTMTKSESETNGFLGDAVTYVMSVTNNSPGPVTCSDNFSEDTPGNFPTGWTGPTGGCGTPDAIADEGTPYNNVFLITSTSADSGACFSTFNCPGQVTNGSICAEVNVTSGRAELLWRQNGASTYQVSLGPNASDGTDSEIRVITDGAYSVLAAANMGYSNSTWYDVCMVVNGFLIQMYVNGTLVISATDPNSSFASGNVGVESSYGPASAQFANVVVTTTATNYLNTTITDTLPTNLTYTSCSGASCSNSGGVVNWNIGTVNASSSQSVTLIGNVTGTCPESIINQASWSIGLPQTVVSSNAVTDTINCVPTATDTSTMTNTWTNTPTATFTSSPTPTITSTNTSTHTPTSTASNTSTATLTNTPTLTATFTDSNTPTLTSTWTPTATPTQTFSPTATSTDTNTLTNTSTPTASNTSTYTDTNTPTPTPTNTFTSTSTPTDTNTFVNTPTNTNTLTNTSTSTASNTSTYTDTNTPTPTQTNTFTSTSTPTDTNTFVNTPTNTNTSTNTSTLTASNTSTDTNTNTPTPTQTNTFTSTSTPTDTNTFVNTPTNTNTSTNTLTSTPTPTASNTPTPTNTLTPTDTLTNTSTPTLTPTQTNTNSPTSTLTASTTPTNSSTATLTPTGTPTLTWTQTPTNTATSNHTPTFSPTNTPINTWTPTPPAPSDVFWVCKNMINLDLHGTVCITIGTTEIGETALKIYNSAGEHIKTLYDENSNEPLSPITLTWDGTNKYGDKVASGVYIIYFTEPLEIKIARLIVIH